MSLLDHFTSFPILTDLQESSKIAVLKRLIQALDVKNQILDANLFLEDILRRESLGSTILTDGMAIPHARTNAITKPLLAFGRTIKEIPFNEVSGEKARVFFLFGSPPNESTLHLRVLAELARILKEKKNRGILLKEKNHEALLRCFFNPQDESE